MVDISNHNNAWYRLLKVTEGMELMYYLINSPMSHWVNKTPWEYIYN